jgi:hypothetical protein
MKNFHIILLFSILLFSAFYSCSDTPTYAELLSAEKDSIKNFMDVKGYKYTTVYPDTIPFPDGLFYLTESGLYVHVIDTGLKIIDSIPENTVITVRFLETNMSGDTTYSNMYGTGDPYELLYNNVQTSTTYGDCKAWHEALDYVGDGGHVNLIVPSKLGMSMYSSSSTELTPCFYDVRYTFWK